MITHIFEIHSIPHAVFKGAHTRETAYSIPTARPAIDIDILISSQEKEKAITLLTNAGFTPQADPKKNSHEITFFSEQTFVDLHWHILRPGRVPKSLTEELLDGRKKHGSYWSLNGDDHFFILLIHPVFTKYPSATTKGLIRFTDLIYWLNTQTVDWERVYLLLEKTGLSSAAWITLEYLHILSGKTVPEDFIDRISPSAWKRWYLEKWIGMNMPARFHRTPLIPKIFFTLLGHDSLGQVFQFFKTFASDRFAKQ